MIYAAKNRLTGSLLLALLAFPTSSYAQELSESARAYYVGFATKDAAKVFGEVTVENASDMSASFFYRVQANPDGVVSADDTYDYIRASVADRNHTGTADFGKYDLDQDGVTTQSELEISQSKRTWVSAAAVFLETRSNSAVQTRFKELLSEKTIRLHESVGVSPGADVEASGETYSPTEDLERSLERTRRWGPPYFVVFDVNADSKVEFDEFFEPIFLAITAADTNSDGVLSDDELEVVSTEFKTAEDQLSKQKDHYSFSDPR